MKKYFITVFVILFFVGVNVYSESMFSHKSSSNNVKEILDVLKQKDATEDDLTEFDIMNGTASSKPRHKSVSTSKPLRGYFNSSQLKLEIYINDIFDVEIIDKATGNTVKTLVINPALNPETYIDINSLGSGDYTIYFYGRSAVEDDDYYYGAFSIK